MSNGEFESLRALWTKKDILPKSKSTQKNEKFGLTSKLYASKKKNGQNLKF